MNPSGQPQCMSCGKPLTPEMNRQKHGGNSTPMLVDCCWECWTSMTSYQRCLIVIAIQDRQVGGVLAEMAAALDRLDQSRVDDGPGEDWKNPA